MGERLAALISGRRTAWVVLLLTVALGGAVIVLGGSPRVSDAPAAGLSASAESSRAARLQRELRSARVTAAVIVYARAEAPLSRADLAAITRKRAGTPRVSKDGRAATVVVPLPRRTDAAVLADEVGRVRAAARADLPPGLTGQVTGPAGVTADLAGVFDGAGRTLLIATDRSPWLWLVPLAAVGLADRVTAALVAVLSRHTGLDVSNATIGIVEVLVFGAGTDYALLLIARYPGELRRRPGRRGAGRRGGG